LLTVSHWGYDGRPHEGRIVVHARHAEAIVEVFRQIWDARFPIERMVPVAEYGGDDGASMRANNTSGFNCRYVAGTTRVSEHALGQAIDVNPLHNPYVKGGSVDPPEGARWRSEEHTSELQSRENLVCRLLLEKKKHTHVSQSDDVTCT